MKKTLFSVILFSVLCAYGNIALAVLPTITYVAPIPAGCAGTFPSMSFSSTGAPTTYSITWAGSPSGLPNVPAGTSLPFTGIPIVTMPNLASGTYTGSFIVSNTDGASAPVSITVTINGLPAVYSVTGGGGLCAGTAGYHISLTNSEGGVLYQLKRGGSNVGTPIWGAVGVALDFGVFTTPGFYSVTATNAGSGCTRNMSGTATISVYPVPVPVPVTGGGGYCTGGPGLPVGVSGSVFGTNYQLMLGGSPVGAPLAGAGTSLDFGPQTTAGVYTVVATDTSSPFCPATMTGSALVVVYPTPTVYNVTGGGSFCIGGYGVHVGLTNSNFGITYKLYRNGTYLSAATGTSLPLDFGLIALDGTYTARAINATYGCTENMIDSALLTYIPLVTPTLSIGTSNGTTLCFGTTDSFFTHTAFPGPTPTFTWKVNGAFAGYGSSIVYTPADRDHISVTMTSDATCATPSVLNDDVMISVRPALVPTVVMSASPATAINGSTDTLIAIIVNGGLAPTYQWYLNGALVAGATSRFFISNAFKDGDVATFKVQGCADSMGTGTIVVHVVARTGIREVSAGGSNIHIYPNPGNGSFAISGDLNSTAGNEQVAIVITDLAGRVVYSANSVSANGKVDEHITLPASVGKGVYILNLRSASENVISQVIVE